MAICGAKLDATIRQPLAPSRVAGGSGAGVPIYARSRATRRRCVERWRDLPRCASHADVAWTARADGAVAGAAVRRRLPLALVTACRAA
ncbi:MAG: hypothetical protein MZV65_32230 [Chromatiales bacterium]|nr:hypothetical protein [Chromatiales bacterium]